MSSNKTGVNTYTVKTFAAARELIGPRVELALPTGARVTDLRTSLLKAYPSLGELKDFAIARNENYALPEEEIQPGDELVIIPPVSGG